MKYLIFLILLAGCAKYEDESVYTIHQGDHWATPYRVQRYNRDTLRMLVNFSNDCLYDESKQAYPGWNKLGYWYCGIHPHINSGATFVWRSIDFHLIIGWYIWADGGSPMETAWDGSQFGIMGEIQPETDYVFEIYSNDSIVFVVNGNIVETKFRFKPIWILPPYFGGQETAMSDLTIKRIIL